MPTNRQNQEKFILLMCWFTTLYKKNISLCTIFSTFTQTVLCLFSLLSGTESSWVSIEEKRVTSSYFIGFVVM